jgi:hypothetical protein
MPPWRDRLVGSAEVPPESLIPNPRNWRIHPQGQQAPLADVLDQVGWVARVKVNKTTGHVVDGHLRVGMAIERGEPTVPVDYVDLTEDEERLVLASLDPLAGLAQTDEAALQGLLSDIDGAEGALADMLAGLMPFDPGAGTADPPPSQERIEREEAAAQDRFRGEAERRQGQVTDIECPACGHTFGIEPASLTG